jgi:hypothetical protein
MTDNLQEMDWEMSNDVYKKTFQTLWPKRYEAVNDTADWEREFQIAYNMSKKLEESRCERTGKNLWDKIIHICDTAPFPVLVFLFLLLQEYDDYGFLKEIDMRTLFEYPFSSYVTDSLIFALKEHFQEFMKKQDLTSQSDLEVFWPSPKHTEHILWLEQDYQWHYKEEHFFDHGGFDQDRYWALVEYFRFLQSTNCSVTKKRLFLEKFSVVDEQVFNVSAKAFCVSACDILDDSNQPDFNKCFDALVCLKLGARIQDSNDWNVVLQYVQMHEPDMFQGAHHLLKTHLS